MTKKELEAKVLELEAKIEALEQQIGQDISVIHHHYDHYEPQQPFHPYYLPEPTRATRRENAGYNPITGAIRL